jgi:hypothetical protein
MTTSTTGAPDWTSSTGGGTALAAPQTRQATRAKAPLAAPTQRGENEYLSQQRAEIGRVTGPNELELFVSSDAALALRQQFERVHPEFIVVHDIGTTSSRKLLRGLAAASGRSLQKLAIRRQGYGQALATLFFLELPATNGQTLRMYTTQVETDAATRKGMARVLLAFSRLGVVMVGNVTAQTLQPELDSMGDDIAAGLWRNRHLLMLPLASASNLAAHASALAKRTGVRVRTTPVVSRPAEAWGYISDTWKRLNGHDTQGPTSRSPPPEALIPELPVEPPLSAQPWAGSTFSTIPSRLPSVAPSSGAPLQGPPTLASATSQAPGIGMPGSPDRPASAPMPAASARAANRPPEVRATASARMGLSEPMRSQHASQSTQPAEHGMLQRYVRLLSGLNGLRSCCVFDIASGVRLAHSGNSHSAAELGRQGQLLLSTMLAAGKALGSGAAIPEAAVTLGAHHLLLRGVPRHPDAVLHAVFDKATANLTLARLQVLRLDALFEEAPHGA